MPAFAKILEKLFFGSVGGARTIMNAVTNGPTDAQVTKALAQAGQQPLRFIFTAVLEDPPSLTVILNTLSGLPVITRSSTGVYLLTLTNGFKGVVPERTIAVHTVGSILVRKANNSNVNLYSRDESGTLSDEIFTAILSQQVEVEVIPGATD